MGDGALFRERRKRDGQSSYRWEIEALRNRSISVTMDMARHHW
jgi:hypothetical protein